MQLLFRRPVSDDLFLLNQQLNHQLSQGVTLLSHYSHRMIPENNRYFKGEYVMIMFVLFLWTVLAFPVACLLGQSLKNRNILLNQYHAARRADGIVYSPEVVSKRYAGEVSINAARMKSIH